MAITGRKGAGTLLAAAKAILLTAPLFVVLSFALGSGTSARTEVSTEQVVASVEAMLTELQAEELDGAAADFGLVKRWWTANKRTVKASSLDLSLEIDRQIANLSLAFLNGDAGRAADEAGALRFSLRNYADGAYTDNDGKRRMSLGAYVMKLRGAADLMERERWTEAREEVRLLQRQWLSVEGDVVSRSQTVYNHAERDLVLLDAYLANSSQRGQALPVAERMIESLDPLVDASYSWIDAALIPLREGLEALLVVGTLLMYARKSDSGRARNWVVAGSAAGVLASIGVGLAVSLLLSSGAFGRNNSLINGWTGVLASLLLLYVSYWLHRNSDMKRWGQFLKSESARAMTSGRMASLALLAFFAIVREGLETVIFLVGMVGKLPAGQLVGGIAAGFGVLAVCALLMIRLGARLPVRPVFLVSSAIVFYLCFKFMGSGVHSLQMAGALPSTVHEYLPEYGELGLYPSWYSTFPQFLFLLAAISVVLLRRFIGSGDGRNGKSPTTATRIDVK
ncbi:FTR1 family iron permease [Cohnella cellulosilytica]|uniref:FTR1 family protein n=1 Tax=Cohnella cellulosilytica TaxID=986710 RepID=A0ABW2F2Y5_9BACL